MENFPTKILSETEMIALNEKFGLDLNFSDGSHYRAAQVIWALDKAMPLIQDPAKIPAQNTPASSPSHEGTS